MLKRFNCIRAKKNNNEKGMTLIEIMIVLAIVGVLMATLGRNVLNRLSSAQVKQAKIQMGEISKALEMYYTDCGFFPGESAGLTPLITDEGGDCSNWGPEPYLKKVPKDPWGQEFIYEQTGSSFVLRSLGKDRKEGGSGSGKDLSSEDL